MMSATCDCGEIADPLVIFSEFLCRVPMIGTRRELRAGYRVGTEGIKIESFKNQHTYL